MRIDADRNFAIPGSTRRHARPAILRPLALLCAIGSLGVASTDAAAQSGAPVYQVEVVIFAQPAGTSAELPPAGRTRPESQDADFESGDDPDLAVEVGDPSAGPDSAPPLLPDSLATPALPLQLSAVAARLNSGGYRLLWHQGWVQAPAAGVALDLATLAALGQGPAVPGLSGTISLMAGRFLHLGVDVELQSGATPEAELRQRHRIRQGVEHYLDGPHIGIVALVRRVTDESGDGQSTP